MQEYIWRIGKVLITVILVSISTFVFTHSTYAIDDLCKFFKDKANINVFCQNGKSTNDTPTGIPPQCIPLSSNDNTAIGPITSNPECALNSGGCQTSTFEQINTTLQCGWQPDYMSRICSTESQGGQVNICSRSDLCVEEVTVDGTTSNISYSCGLFQINIIDSTRKEYFPHCQNLIIPKSPESIGSSNYNDRELGACAVPMRPIGNTGKYFCPKRKCGLAPGKTAEDYKLCLQELANPVNNIEAACKIYQNQGYSAWGGSAGKCIQYKK